jgi:ATP-binding cassette, subfamily C (CFTR/MRP), member 1
MATQTRISITKAILDSVKNIKMMGLADKMQDKIQTARDHEIDMSISFNWLIMAFNASGEFRDVPSCSRVVHLLGN